MTSPSRPPLPQAFWRLWWGESTSTFGSFVNVFTLQVLILRVLDGSEQDVGWVNAARWLPYLLLGVVAGVLIDRVRRRPVMIATDLACALLVAVIPVAYWFDALSFPLLLVVVLLYGTASLFNDGASMAFLPRVVDRRGLQAAHARLDGSSAVAQAGGPAVAGAVIQVVGAPVTLLLDALSYLFAAVMTATIRVADPRPGGVGPRDVRAEIRDGVRWVYRAGAQRSLALGTHLWFAGNALLGVAVPVLALDVLDLTTVQFGVATAMAGVGAMVGAGISSRVGRRLGTGGAIIAAHVVSVLGVAVMVFAGLGQDGWVAAGILGAGQTGHGLAMGMSNSHEMSYRQALTPDRLQARVNVTMRSANRAVIVIGAPLSGQLIAAVGVRPAMVVAAGVFAAVVAVLARSSFRTERLDG